VLGEAPTHRQLLDWLAAEFVAKGWSLKVLHHRILKSETWRQNSQFDEASFTADGENRFLFRDLPKADSSLPFPDSAILLGGSAVHKSK
jgi:hypothetical protein